MEFINNNGKLAFKYKDELINIDDFLYFYESEKVDYDDYYKSSYDNEAYLYKEIGDKKKNILYSYQDSESRKFLLNDFLLNMSKDDAKINEIFLSNKYDLDLDLNKLYKLYKIYLKELYSLYINNSNNEKQMNDFVTMYKNKIKFIDETYAKSIVLKQGYKEEQEKLKNLKNKKLEELENLF